MMPINFISNLAALRAIDHSTLTDGDVIYVCHHSLNIDQGGGNFVWDSAFLGTISDRDPININLFDNNGTFICPNSITSPASAAGRWRRIDSVKSPSVMQVDWFGAISGGSNLDSLPAIQAAVDALPLRLFGYTPEEAKTPSGRFIRIGCVELSPGTYFIGNTLYLTCYSTLRGRGKIESTLQAIGGAFPMKSGERFMVMFERPAIISDNNSFNTICENLSLLGDSLNGNEGLSGLSIFGAQGSWVKDINILSVGIRGLVVRGIPVLGVCWFANCLRGPMVDMSGGPGIQCGALSIEHCNQKGTHIDETTGIPFAALRIEGVSVANFQQLQFEGGPVDISIRNSQRITFEKLISNVSGLNKEVNGYPTYGVYITGDSYNNEIPEFFYIGPWSHARPYWDDSDLAGHLGRVGKIPPRLPQVVRPEFQVTSEIVSNGSNMAAMVIRKSESLGWFVTQSDKIPPGSQCRIEIAGYAREWAGQFLGFPGVFGTSNLNPEVLPSGVLSRILISRTTTDGTSGRISKALIVGKGSRLNAVPEPDLTFGAAPPPEVVFTIINGAENDRNGISKVIASSTSDEFSGHHFSVNIEVL